jgi:hypothetical protein
VLWIRDPDGRAFGQSNALLVPIGGRRARNLRTWSKRRRRRKRKRRRRRMMGWTTPMICQFLSVPRSLCAAASILSQVFVNEKCSQEKLMPAFRTIATITFKDYVKEFLVKLLPILM